MKAGIIRCMQTEDIMCPGTAFDFKGYAGKEMRV